MSHRVLAEHVMGLSYQDTQREKREDRFLESYT